MFATALIATTPTATAKTRPDPTPTPAPTQITAWKICSLPTLTPSTGGCAGRLVDHGRVWISRAAAWLGDSHGEGLAGKTLIFTSVLGTSCATTTGSGGVAAWTCADVDTTFAGFTVVFAGDAAYAASSATVGPLPSS